MNYDSVREITLFLGEEGLGLKKRWGQNFMINRGAREKIVATLAPEVGERVWEIGPGLGAITGLLLARETRLTVFEVDRGMIKALGLLYPGSQNFRIRQGDVLKTWKKELADNGTPDRILGNLPYSSASAIIASIIEEGVVVKRMVYTIQKELAQRMTASRGSKNYSSFSVFCQYSYDTRITMELKPGSFFPAPEVTSSVIEMVPCAREHEPRDKKLFFQLVRTGFHSRRKTLLNNLINSPLGARFGRDKLSAALTSSGIGPLARGESLEIEDFIALADRLEE